MILTSQRLQKVAVGVHVLTIIFLLIAGSLYGDGYRRFNNDQIGNISVCFLFNKFKDFTSNSSSFLFNKFKDFTSNSSSNSICVFSILGEFMSALGLVPLVILSIVKLVRRLIG